VDFSGQDFSGDFSDDLSGLSNGEFSHEFSDSLSGLSRRADRDDSYSMSSMSSAANMLTESSYVYSESVYSSER
jgi:hypothetical protein